LQSRRGEWEREENRYYKKKHCKRQLLLFNSLSNCVYMNLYIQYLIDTNKLSKINPIASFIQNASSNKQNYLLIMWQRVYAFFLFFFSKYINNQNRVLFISFVFSLISPLYTLTPIILINIFSFFFVTTIIGTAQPRLINNFCYHLLSSDWFYMWLVSTPPLPNFNHKYIILLVISFYSKAFYNCNNRIYKI
jgi:hypothetical protein